jgi:hypothetical protein
MNDPTGRRSTWPTFSWDAHDRARARATAASAKALAEIEEEIAERVEAGLDTGDDGGRLYDGPNTVVPVHYTGRGRTNFLRWIAGNLRKGLENG